MKKDQDQILGHFSKFELLGFDEAQGGMDDNNPLKIRQYPFLGKIMSEPGHAEEYLKKYHSFKPYDTPQMGKKAQVFSEKNWTPAPGDNQEFIKNLKKQGTQDNDGVWEDEIALIPRSFAKLLNHSFGKSYVNKKTGLYQFTIDPISATLAVASIGASILGGVMGDRRAKKERAAFEANERRKEEENKRREQEYIAYMKQEHENEKKYRQDEFNKKVFSFADAVSKNSRSINGYSDGDFVNGTIFGKYRPGYANGDQIKAPIVKKKFPKTGLIKGPGKGQTDNLHGDVREKSFIVNASVVSGLGDGSTNAGKNTLDKLVKKAKNTYPVPKTHQKTVPVALSTDEYVIDTDDVSAIGQGNNWRGVQKLRNLQRNVMRDKTRNGDRLPPPAKNPFFYMQ